MWTSEQICDQCWTRREGGRQPYRLKLGDRVRTRCGLCQWWTESGIYLRIETVELPE